MPRELPFPGTNPAGNVMTDSQLPPEPRLDPAEQRLVDAVRRACRQPETDVSVLLQRVRNRAEKYRELVRRVRFDGAAAQIADVGARLTLFETLIEELEASRARPEDR
jgi:BMFP domain-containing protein YqiC